MVLSQILSHSIFHTPPSGLPLLEKIDGPKKETNERKEVFWVWKKYARDCFKNIEEEEFIQDNRFTSKFVYCFGSIFER